MKPIGDLVEELDDFLGQLDNVDLVIARAQTLGDLSEALMPRIEELEAAAEFSESALIRGVLTSSLRVQGTRAAEDLCRKLAEDLGSAENPRIDPAASAALSASIADVAREAKAGANDAWRYYCRSNGPPEINELLDVFDELNPDAAEELRNHVRTCEMNASAAMPKDATIQAFQSAASKIPALLSDLVGDEPEVRSFVQALGSGGASLDDLTPAVLSWMADRELPDGRSSPLSSQ